MILLSVRFDHVTFLSLCFAAYLLCNQTRSRLRNETVNKLYLIIIIIIIIIIIVFIQSKDKNTYPKLQ